MEVFVAAVEHGSLAAAARRYGLTPAMAGKYLAAVEQALQVRLLQRSTRKLVLTSAGERYYARCKQLLEGVVEANAEARAAHTSVRGRLRIAAPVSFASRLGPALADFLRQHPELQAEVLLDDRYIDLLDGAIDVALRIGKLPDSQLVARRIATCPMRLCAAPPLLAAAGHSATADALAALPRVVFDQAVSAGDWTLVSPGGASRIIDGPCRMAANHMATLVSAAVEGLGLVYGPAFAFQNALAAGQLVDALPGWHGHALDLHAVFPAARHLPVKVNLLVEHLIEHFGGEV